MFYIDTSVLVAYYCPEPLSEKVEEILLRSSRPVISSLTEIEIFSALSRKIREGNLNRKDANRIAAKFIGHVNGYYYTSLSVEANHYRLARDWIGLFNNRLRTLDALHLAIAHVEGFPFLTADHELAKSAKVLGIEATILNP